MEFLLCPVCKSELKQQARSFLCEKGHCFDIAKEGYVNLITGSKSGDLTGDNKDMARSRKAFLDKGYFRDLSDSLCNILGSITPSNVLDICCGEGYYAEEITKKLDCFVYGFDLSKEMIRLAAKRKSKAEFFVANMANIPVADNSIDCAIHLFAPFCEKEFLRIIKPGGYLISICPGAKHLWELKAALYENPYENEEISPDLPGFSFQKAINTVSCITLADNNDIESLFKMTPYYYHTSPQDKAKLSSLDTLTTHVDFYIRIYRKD